MAIVTAIRGYVRGDVGAPARSSSAAAARVLGSIPIDTVRRLRNVASDDDVVVVPAIGVPTVLTDRQTFIRLNPLASELTVRLRERAAREPQRDAAADHFGLVYIAEDGCRPTCQIRSDKAW
jgi:hypothetical protein